MKRQIFTIIAALLLFAQCADCFAGTNGQVQLTADQMQLVKQNNSFAFNLFRQARDGNTVLSPLSITYALGMVNNGAAGETQREINDVLGFGNAGAAGINQFCLDMRLLTESLDPETKVMIANNIYVNSGFVLQSDFVSKAKTYYDATPETRDFNPCICNLL